MWTQLSNDSFFCLVLGSAFIAFTATANTQEPEISADSIIANWLSTSERISESAVVAEKVTYPQVPDHPGNGMHGNTEYQSAHFSSNNGPSPLDETNRGYVWLANPDYAAKLIRLGSGPWLLDDLSLKTDKGHSKYVSDIRNSTAFRFVAEAMGITPYLKNKSYSVTDFSTQEIENKTFYVLDLQFLPLNLDDEFKSARAWFEKNPSIAKLLPDRLEIEFVRKSGQATYIYDSWVETGTNVLPTALTTYAGVHSIAAWSAQKKPEIGGIFTFDYDRWDESPDKAKSHLSYYGLPEPPNLNRSNPLLLWTIVLVAIALIGGFIFFVANRVNRT